MSLQNSQNKLNGLHPRAVGIHLPLVWGIGDQGQQAINAD